MFKRKGRLRWENDEKLLTLLTECKNQWLKQKRIIEESIEPSEEVLHQVRLAEAKYLFLLKEARQRKMVFSQNNNHKRNKPPYN
ncbi:YaaL family protein [Camelliibacillus cellulosilyticus]|uniref:YaaL family protein n=1 Tax=Camelliibacillus cellulosilyticus TaxID=2174486 RepID=A0ABV9GS31_9BACL